MYLYLSDLLRMNLLLILFKKYIFPPSFDQLVEVPHV